MLLFRIVHQQDGERRVMICEAGALIFARIEAGKAKFGGTFVEAHELDPKMAKRIPRKAIGRTLTLDEAAALLDRLA